MVRYSTEQCFRAVQGDHLLQLSGLPVALRTRTFAGADRGGRRGQYLDMLRDSAWATGARGIYVHGDNGVGKSYGTHCLVTHLAQQLTRVQWVTSVGIVQSARRGMDEGARHEDPLRRYTSAQVLVIDDLGKESLASDWGREQLFGVIDSRVNDGAPMVITSNWGPDNLARRLGENYGAAIVDRLLGSCDLIELAGESLRRR